MNFPIMDIKEAICTMCIIAVCYKLIRMIKFTLIWRFLFTGMLAMATCRRPRHMVQCPPICVPRRGWLLTLIGVSVALSFGLVYLDYSLALKLRSKTLEEALGVMRTRLKFHESQYFGMKQEVAEKQAAMVVWCKTQDGTDNGGPNTTLTPELLAYLKKINGSKASDGLLSSDGPEPIKVPFSLRIMTHLMDDPKSLTPAYQMKSTRHFSDYIIGIPHVKRDKETYLYETLKHLLNKMSDEDRNYTMIVVMIGETNMTYVIETTHNIELNFPDAINAGLIDVVSPQASYYPDLDALPQTLGDSKKRVKWRTKQNLDEIYLMAYSYSRCLYFLIIEDDVLSDDNYMEQIRKYTVEVSVTNPDWFFIQYSTTGGIGKLFRSTDLIHFMTYVQLFYTNMPIDWLTESYLTDLKCGINKGAKECAEAKAKIRPTYRNNLFKHIGLFSSLKGKIQKIKPVHNVGVVQKRNFTRLNYRWPSRVKPYKYWFRVRNQRAKNLNAPIFFPHDNPPVTEIKCDMGSHKNYTIQNAYHGNSYFWGKAPRKDDVIEFWFETPAKFERYLVRSGNTKHPTDKIYTAVFEVLPVSNTKNGSFVTIDRFDEFGMVEGRINSTKYGDLYAMRIRFENDSKFWVAITEIDFQQLDDFHGKQSTLPVTVDSKT